MKTQITITLLGLVAFASANSYAGLRKLQTIPVPKNYVAPAAPAAPVASYDEEPVEEKVEKVVYKAPTRVVERQPIRVAYNQEEERPVSRGGYGGYGGAVERDDSLEQEYARNAQYQFASAVDDGIMDQSHIRQETRDGLKVTGTYAYSDGYFKRTVNYEADENGYRVVGESVEPISESGPQIDLVNGKAEVHTQIGGVNTQYSVSADELDINRKRLASFKKDH